MFFLWYNKQKLVFYFMDRHTKIICTIGPASEKPQTIKNLMKNGMDVARLNFAYGSYDWHKKVIKIIRNTAKKMNRPIAIIEDVRGVYEKRHRKDIEFGIKNNVDYIALSYVRTEEDVLELRRIIKSKIDKKKGAEPDIIAKIEMPQAIKNFKSILKASDGIMVARGDLGVETPIEGVPILQKEIAEKCILATKPVIVATQMLLSMTEKTKPTRAEVSDVANAVVDHADAVMLSEETSIGKHPIQAVKMMSKIIKRAEDSPFDNLEHGFLGDGNKSVPTAIADAAHELSKYVEAKAIVAATASGFTAKMVARHRPENFVIMATNDEKVYHKMALIWGVSPYIIPYCETLDALLQKAVHLVINKGIAKKKDRIVIVTGQPVGAEENMNLVKAHTI